MKKRFGLRTTLSILARALARAAVKLLLKAISRKFFAPTIPLQRIISPDAHALRFRNSASTHDLSRSYQAITIRMGGLRWWARGKTTLRKSMSLSHLAVSVV